MQGMFRRSVISIDTDPFKPRRRKSITEDYAPKVFELEIRWRGLTYELHPAWWMPLASKRTVLRNISGRMKGGELTALMGPSGAGKSTLLDCLTGRRIKGLSGEMKVTGGISGEPNKLRMAFVPQHDFLLTRFSVKETLMYASKFKNAAEHNFDHRSVVRNILKQLGLEGVKNNRVNRCSGGQQKRVAIGQELVSRPNVLVLDEPTSGLDSKTCYNLVKLLADLVQEQSPNDPLAIVCTIHQPAARVFDLFHHVYILSRFGETLYEGSPNEVMNTCAKVGLNPPAYYNPADYIIEVATGDYGTEYISAMVDLHRRKYGPAEFLSTGPGVTLEDNRNPLEALSEVTSWPFWSNFVLHFKRSWLQIQRDPVLTGLRLLAHIATPLLIGVMYGNRIGREDGCPKLMKPLIKQELEEVPDFDEEKDRITHQFKNLGDNFSGFFFALLVIMFSALETNVLAFPTEIQVVRKEYQNGWYSPLSYYIGRGLADFPFALFYPMLYMVIFWFLTEQPDDDWWRLPAAMWFAFQNAFISEYMGFIFGALFMEHLAAAVFLAPMSTIPQFMFGGFFVRIKSMPWYLRPLYVTSHFYFEFSGFLVALYGYDRCVCDEELIRTNITRAKWVDFLEIVLDPKKAKKPRPRITTTTTTTMAPTTTLSSTTLDLITTTLATDFVSMDPSIGEEVSKAYLTAVESQGAPANGTPAEIFLKALETLNTAGSATALSCDTYQPIPLKEFDVKEDDIYICAAALLAYMMAFYFVTYFVVRFKVVSKS